LLDACAQERLRGRQTADFICQYVHQLGLSIWAAVGQGALEVIPYTFIWIQFWGIWRKWCQVQPRRAGEKLLYGIAAVNLTVIQKNDQVASYLM